MKDLLPEFLKAFLNEDTGFKTFLLLAVCALAFALWRVWSDCAEDRAMLWEYVLGKRALPPEIPIWLKKRRIRRWRKATYILIALFFCFIAAAYGQTNAIELPAKTSSRDFDGLVNWLTTLTPDKLALVLPCAIGYVIVRVRRINTAWCWVICPLLAAVLFGILGTNDPTRNTAQNWTYRICIGLLLGIVAAIGALGIHSVAFKFLADKFPWLKFLVASEEPESKPTESPK